MYLSNLLVDLGENPDRPRPGRTWLRNMYHVHQRLCMAFPSDNRILADPDYLKHFHPNDFSQAVHSPRELHSGFLFRVDPLLGGRAMIIVQSALEPNWRYAFRNAEMLLSGPVQVKTYTPCFDAGQSLRFRLMANTTRKVDTKTGPDGLKRNGRRKPVADNEIIDWLLRRAEDAGFSLDNGSLIFQPGYIMVRNKGDYEIGRLRSVRFEGVLRVKDADRFRNSVIQGIGPAKAFGFGLLSVAPYRP